MRYPAADRITCLEWLALSLILLGVAGVLGALVGGIIFAIRALRAG
jgi:hypothetical protein